RAAGHAAPGCEVSDRAYFLWSLAKLREDQGRFEESLALGERAAKLYGALRAIDYQAAVLSDKAALEIRSEERDEALKSLSSIIALMDHGLQGRFALGAAVSFAALISVSFSSLADAVAILEKVRRRYPELADSEEMAALHLLEGRLLIFSSRP